MNICHDCHDWLGGCESCAWYFHSNASLQRRAPPSTGVPFPAVLPFKFSFRIHAMLICPFRVAFETALAT